MNQQLTTVTEEIEELKSRKEQLIFQAQCSTDKDMTNLSKKYDQMNNNLDILDSQDISLKKQLEKDAAAFREEKFHPEPEQYTELLDTRIQIRPDFRDKLIEQLKGTFGKYYDYTVVILQPMRWIISMWKTLMFSPIVHGNLNIRENRKCGEISLLGLRKGHMIWNCNHLKYCPGTINGAETMNNIHTLLF